MQQFLGDPHDKVDEIVHDVSNFYNLTTSLATSLSYYQLILHIRSVLANLWDSLSYIRTVSMHIMDYINAATTGTLSPHIPPMGVLNLKAHRLALAIVKKTLNENHFRSAQKTTDRQPPSFQIGDRVYFKNKQPSKWDLKRRPGHRTVLLEHDGHFLHIEDQATGKVQSCNVKNVVHESPIEFWNIDTQFGRAGKYVNHPANLPTKSLHD